MCSEIPRGMTPPPLFGLFCCIRGSAQARPGSGGHRPPRASMASPISASGERNPKAIRVSSRSLVLTDSTRPLDSPCSKVAWMPARWSVMEWASFTNAGMRQRRLPVPPCGVPGLAADLIQRVGCPPHDVEGVQAQHDCRAPAGDRVGDPGGRIRAHMGELAGAILAKSRKEAFQGLLVVAGRG